MMTRMIDLNGRAEALAYTVNSLCMLEEISGKPLSKVLSGDLTGMRALLWCGLIRSHPDLTLERAGEWLDAYLLSGGALETLCEKITGALEDAGFFHRAKRTA